MISEHRQYESGESVRNGGGRMCPSSDVKANSGKAKVRKRILRTNYGGVSREALCVEDSGSEVVPMRVLLLSGGGHVYW